MNLTITVVLALFLEVLCHGVGNFELDCEIVDCDHHLVIDLLVDNLHVFDVLHRYSKVNGHQQAYADNG